jgi:predicted RNA-binding Zn ribbon-like protein
MMVRTFLFVAGAPALDFLNTEAVIDGQPADLLQDEHDLQRWLAEAGLGRAAATKNQLRETKALRAELRRLFLRLAAGERLRAADLAAINESLGGTACRLEVELRDGRPRLRTTAGNATPAFLVAKAAAEFLSSADLSRIRRCEGHGCILVFYDTTRSRTRRWCSMAGCGNRAKAAAHYERIKRSAH